VRSQWPCAKSFTTAGNIQQALLQLAMPADPNASFLQLNAKYKKGCYNGMDSLTTNMQIESAIIAKVAMPAPIVRSCVVCLG